MSPQSSTTSSNPTRFTLPLDTLLLTFSVERLIYGAIRLTTYRLLSYRFNGHDGNHWNIATRSDHRRFTIGAMVVPPQASKPEAFGVTFSVNAGVTLPDMC